MLFDVFNRRRISSTRRNWIYPSFMSYCVTSGHNKYYANSHVYGNKKKRGYSTCKDTVAVQCPICADYATWERLLRDCKLDSPFAITWCSIRVYLIHHTITQCRKETDHAIFKLSVILFHFNCFAKLKVLNDKSSIKIFKSAPWCIYVLRVIEVPKIAGDILRLALDEFKST